MRSGASERMSPRGWRVSRSAVFALAGLILVIAGIRLAHPLGTIRQQQDELARLHQQKASLTADNARLERYQHDLATDRGLERAVRRKGYLKANERRLVFTPEESKSQTAPQPSPQQHKAK